MNEATTVDRLMRLEEVLHTTGLGRNTVYRRMREGIFPRQVRLGPNSVAWRQSDIARWVESPSTYSTALEGGEGDGNT
ncbi:DNA-binding protein [Pseudomonas sp. ATCC 13867]|uniref:helix-turn-helix transcriptional regulator n=1 Tax=Pseudomonas sp. ATCC 13867 TaxID=1294143 RepID=UPI0002C4F206|nr:AlpA family transcriptional regulator [Pseudomonas sp. ATCC 13867]AGI26490.1 DNA-binding protein [Pseudomonas sp. ATCC 13867]RFQ21411.1 AlpA family transcriptional regulator [Pseudomonas sp. ATCC 13867]